MTVTEYEQGFHVSAHHGYLYLCLMSSRALKMEMFSVVNLVSLVSAQSLPPPCSSPWMELLCQLGCAWYNLQIFTPILLMLITLYASIM